MLPSVVPIIGSQSETANYWGILQQLVSVDLRLQYRIIQEPCACN